MGKRSRKLIAERTLIQIYQEYYKNQKSIKEVAKMFGLAETTTRKIITKKGAYAEKEE